MQITNLNHKFASLIGVFCGILMIVLLTGSAKAQAGPQAPPDNAKNNTNQQVTPDKITNEERKKLADCTPDHAQECLKANPLVQWSQTLIKLLGMGVGVIVTIMIIVGGIQYSAAGPNPQAVSAAKKKILNAIIALLAYFFLFAFMQWLVPGGIL